MTTRKNGRTNVTAEVGCGLPVHHRTLRIPKGAKRGEALGCWLAATLYSRNEELDGWCPAEALDSVSTQEARSRLVEVGLFIPSEKLGVAGFIVHKYEEWNETKAQINERLAKDRRRKKSPDSDWSPTDFRTDSDRNPPGAPTDFHSISGRGRGKGEGDVSEGESREGPGLATAPVGMKLGYLGMEREWFASAVRGATDNPGYVAPPARDCGQLLEFIHAGYPGASPPIAEDWVRRAVVDFVAATDGPRRKFYPLDKISGFAKWVAEGRKTAAELDARDTRPSGYGRPEAPPSPKGPAPAKFRRERAEKAPADIGVAAAQAVREALR